MIGSCNTMASAAPVTDLDIADNESPATEDNTCGFLKLSPELRNMIYEYTFSTVIESRPVPHALTQVNKQLRAESQAMYYASIELLILPLRTLDQIFRTQRYIAEVDWSLFPVMPDLEFLSYNPWINSDIRVSLTREEVVPAQELPFYTSFWRDSNVRLSDKEKTEAALGNIYFHCLGVKPAGLTLDSPVPEYFEEVLESGETWIRRKWSYEALGPTQSSRVAGSDLVLWDMIFDKAISKEGYDWDSDDLLEVVVWFGDKYRYRWFCIQGLEWL